MISEKSIGEFEPFNDVFYRNCFYNSLFSVMKFYKKNILPILINETAVYSFNKHPDEYNLTMNYIINYDLIEVLNAMGVSYVASEDCNHIIEKISSLISNQVPLVAQVDRYYMPSRTNYYLKKHWIQSIPVYGFNDTEGFFKIIEQEHDENMSYHKSTIAYNDLLNAINGCTEIWGEDKKIYYYQFNNNDDVKVEDDPASYNVIFKQNIHRNAADIRNGLIEFKEFIEAYKLIVIDENKLKYSMHSLLNGFNYIINSRKAEYYILDNLPGKEMNLINSLELILTKWDFVRSRLGKYIFSSVYRINDFSASIKFLEEIYLAESLYYKELGI